MTTHSGIQPSTSHRRFISFLIVNSEFSNACQLFRGAPSRLASVGNSEIVEFQSRQCLDQLSAVPVLYNT